MKKGLALITALILVVALAGCAQPATPAPAAPAPAAPAAPAPAADEKVTIGITYQNLTNEFILLIADAVEAKAAELGVELIALDGQGNAETQISQVEGFIAQGVDAIILNPFDENGCVPAVNKANEAGIPIIDVNGLVANVDECTSYVGSDSVESGRIAMRAMAEALGGKGNIVVIHGPTGHSAEIDRQEGILDVLKDFPDIKIVAEAPADWDRAKGMSLMENWMQTGEEINGVVGHNDEMAIGALKAIQAAGKTDIKVIGIDAIADALTAVENGEMIGTVFQDAAGQGAGSVEVAYKAAKGETVDKEYMIPYILVTKENLAEYK